MNYGFISNTYNSIGEKQAAYIIDELEFLEEFKGRVVALIRRKNEINAKWIISNRKKKYSIQEIQQIMKIQGQYSRDEIEVRK